MAELTGWQYHIVFAWVIDSYWHRARIIFAKYCQQYCQRLVDRLFGIFLFAYALLFHDFVNNLPVDIISKAAHANPYRWFRRLIFNLRFSRHLHRKFRGWTKRLRLQELFEGALLTKGTSIGFGQSKDASGTDVPIFSTVLGLGDWVFRYCERNFNSGLLLYPVPVSILAEIFQNKWVWFRLFGEFFNWRYWRF